ncbi:hypothetical protein C8Q75DRAFT_745441 [Abortiporus biennis]|nr:hypothetical protein C8Q75DRAFT_745441 [Abortiporus biennis]
MSIPDEVITTILPLPIPAVPGDIYHHGRFPAELWIYIASDPLLRVNDLRALTLTNHRLRTLAQPLLFHTLRVYPSDRAWRKPDWKVHCLSRLESISSTPRFAFAVKQLFVRTVSGESGRIDNILSHSLDDPDEEILNSLFLFITEFKNLRTLSLDEVQLTPGYVIQLNKLPSLRNLYIRCCGIVENEDVDIPDESPLRKLVELSTDDLCIRYGDEDNLNTLKNNCVSKPNSRWWLPLITSGCLRELRLSEETPEYQGTWSQLSSELVPYRDRVSTIRKLEVRDLAVYVPGFMDTIALLTGVEELIFRPSHAFRSTLNNAMLSDAGITLVDICKEPISSSILPNLQTIEMYASWIPSFTPNRRITTLRVVPDFNCDWTSCPKVARILNQLTDDCPQLKSQVTALTFPLPGNTEDGFELFLENLFRIFQSLKELFLPGPITTSKRVNMMLRCVSQTVLPSPYTSLESISIGGRHMVCPYQPPSCILPRHSKTINNLQTHFPNVKNFFFLSRVSYLAWPSRDGRDDWVEYYPNWFEHDYRYCCLL